MTVARLIHIRRLYLDSWLTWGSLPIRFLLSFQFCHKKKTRVGTLFSLLSVQLETFLSSLLLCNVCKCRTIRITNSPTKTKPKTNQNPKLHEPSEILIEPHDEPAPEPYDANDDSKHLEPRICYVPSIYDVSTSIDPNWDRSRRW